MRARRAPLGCVGVLGFVVVLGPSARAGAAPPETPVAPELATANGRLAGRLRVAGTRAPLPASKLLVVAAPPDVVPGRPAREPLDPATVTWIREAQTDDEGRFVLDDMPLGKVRVVVVVAGYARLEQWAEVEAGDARGRELELFLEPDAPGGFRTEVVSERPRHEAQPERVLDAELARVYPGSGGDPLRAAQNLPGMARSPAGVGLIAIRGGDPTLTGIYLDGHPIPRAFHVIPLAAVLSPGTTDRVELNAGNYDAAFGGHAAGMIHVHSKSMIGAEGIHGEAHLDLFDFGGTIRAPVARGGVMFGFRRSHVGDVIRAANRVLAGQGSSIWVPNYWDYIGRFDQAVGRGQQVTLRVLGAGDTIRDQTEVGGPGSDNALDFANGFHRFDAAWSIRRSRLRASISPALRLDEGRIAQAYFRTQRTAHVVSLRSSLAYELSERATLLAGVDLVVSRWSRRNQAWQTTPLGDLSTLDERFDGHDLALGVWWGSDLHVDTPIGGLVVRPQLRLGVFSDGRRTVAMLDPRVDLRLKVHDRVELVAAFGQYAAPRVRPRPADRLGLLKPTASLGAANVDIPQYLVDYFDPGIQGEVRRGGLMVTRTLQGSLGAAVELPWQLRVQATAWWRETAPEQVELPAETTASGGTLPPVEIQSPRRRAYGAEFLLDRPLARDIHGWIGYSVLQSRERTSTSETAPWQPAVFDQRHNLVVLLSAGLPRGFRVGLRFRVVSGNPESAVLGAETVQTPYGTAFRPIRSEFGESYRPVFHQLDLRLDKTWTKKRASVSAYLDVQNVYNRWYPEVYVYSADWRDRSQVIGLPIFPSLGVRVDY